MDIVLHLRGAGAVRLPANACGGFDVVAEIVRIEVWVAHDLIERLKEALLVQSMARAPRADREEWLSKT